MTDDREGGRNCEKIGVYMCETHAYVHCEFNGPEFQRLFEVYFGMRQGEFVGRFARFFQGITSGLWGYPRVSIGDIWETEWEIESYIIYG